MNYFVKRDAAEYGPYTLAELQRYVGSGNVSLTDLCRSEGMTEWVEISKVVGTIPVPIVHATASVSTPGILYPPPPSLNWILAVLLGVVTCGIFGWVLALIQAAWLKKVQPESKV